MTFLRLIITGGAVAGTGVVLVTLGVSLTGHVTYGVVEALMQCAIVFMIAGAGLLLIGSVGKITVGGLRLVGLMKKN